MKKNLMFILFAVFALSLSSCVNQEISKEEFIELANKTESEEFLNAQVKCNAKVKIESSNTEVVKNANEQIDRTFEYTYKNKRWALVSSDDTKYLTDVERSLRDSFHELINKSVKDHLNYKPLSNKDTDGLVFYKNPLTYNYNALYENTKLSITSGVSGKVDGEDEETFKFNNKNGNITYFYEDSDTTVKYTISGYGSVTVHQIQKITANFSYSKK